MKSSIKKAVFILLGYAVLFLMAKLFFQVIFPSFGITAQNLTKQHAFTVLPVFLISIVLTFTTLIYLFNSWLEKKWIHLDWHSVILFMGAAAIMGPMCEIVINTIARVFIGQGLWIYQLLPVHGGDTSIVMSVLWPLYGFHMYCFHTALMARRDKNEEADLALFIGVDAITIEVLVNLFSISFFYTYIFYYYAGDLHHLSTSVIFIPYVLCGFIGVKLLHHLKKSPQRILFGIVGFILNWLLIFVF